MNPVVECAAWVAGIWCAVALGAAWSKHRAGKPTVDRPPLPYRNRDDVLADVEQRRAAADLHTCEAIWNHTLNQRKEQQ